MKNISEKYHFLYHGRIIYSKSSKSKMEDVYLSQIKSLYEEYRAALDPIFDSLMLMEDVSIEYTRDKIGQMIDLFSEYKYQAREMNSLFGKECGRSLLFNSQTKFESTILEEFVSFIFGCLSKIIPNAKFGSVKAYCGEEKYLEINKKTNELELKTVQRTKDQDFSIYLEFNDSNIGKMNYPLIAIECKTYIDKTMLEGAIHTAKRIKTGSKDGKTYLISETSAINEEDLNINDQIDNIIIFENRKRNKKQVRNSPFIKPCFIRLYEILYNDLKGFYNKNSIEENGGFYKK